MRATDLSVLLHGVCSRPLPSRYSERGRERERWIKTHECIASLAAPDDDEKCVGPISDTEARVIGVLPVSSSPPPVAMRAASAAWPANPWTVSHGLAAWALFSSSSAFTMSLGIKVATVGRIGMTTCQNNMMLAA